MVGLYIAGDILEGEFVGEVRDYQGLSDRRYKKERWPSRVVRGEV